MRFISNVQRIEDSPLWRHSPPNRNPHDQFFPVGYCARFFCPVGCMDTIGILSLSSAVDFFYRCQCVVMNFRFYCDVTSTVLHGTSADRTIVPQNLSPPPPPGTPIMSSISLWALISVLLSTMLRPKSYQHWIEKSRKQHCYTKPMSGVSGILNSDPLFLRFVILAASRYRRRPLHLRQDAYPNSLKFANFSRKNKTRIFGRAEQR